MVGIEKFTDKAGIYSKYRPNYPGELFDYLLNNNKINSNFLCADIGAGTGKFTEQIAKYLKKVYAVEPNENMRMEGLKYCKSKNIEYINSTAESINLGDNIVDIITVAQALHWFDIEASKKEFKRILKNNGKVMLLWNVFDKSNILIKEQIEILFKYCPDYKGNSRSIFGGEISINFFGSNIFEHRYFENNKEVLEEEYVGGIMSSSFAPNRSEKTYQVMIDELRNQFNKHSINKKVVLPYRTHCYIGNIS